MDILFIMTEQLYSLEDFFNRLLRSAANKGKAAERALDR